jgi:hypothetical protein
MSKETKSSELLLSPSIADHDAWIGTEGLNLQIQVMQLLKLEMWAQEKRSVANCQCCSEIREYSSSRSRRQEEWLVPATSPFPCHGGESLVTAVTEVLLLQQQRSFDNPRMHRPLAIVCFVVPDDAPALLLVRNPGRHRTPFLAQGRT